jgi:hypothetical protein
MCAEIATPSSITLFVFISLSKLGLLTRVSSGCGLDQSSWSALHNYASAALAQLSDESGGFDVNLTASNLEQSSLEHA